MASRSYKRIPPKKLIGYTKAIRKRYAKMTVLQRRKFWQWVDRERDGRLLEETMTAREKHKFRQQRKARLEEVLKPNTSLQLVYAEYVDTLRHFRNI